MYSNMLTDVIVNAFNTEAGKGQGGAGGERKALLVSFRTRVDYKKEEGYRQVDLLVYGPMNYVGVFARHRWNVVPTEALSDGDDEGLKTGFDYLEGQSEWVKLSYHDSGWRDAINHFMHQGTEWIEGFDNVGGSWHKTQVLSEGQAEHLMSLPHGKLEAPTPIEQLVQATKQQKPEARAKRTP